MQYRSTLYEQNECNKEADESPPSAIKPETLKKCAKVKQYLFFLIKLIKKAFWVQ